METVHITPGEYACYEELTLKKDKYEKEADLYHMAFFREFGELLTLNFQLKIDCISLKKEIALYIKANNEGKTITPEEVEAYLKKQMTGYRQELKRLVDNTNISKAGKTVSDSEAGQIKKIYRRLAKLLHPDISPLTQRYPELANMFNDVIIAYKCNDLKQLQKLEVLINKALEANGIDGFEMIIPDVDERIEELEADIDLIINSAPYTYKRLLEDKDAVEIKKEELKKEEEEYTEYKKELARNLEIIKGGAIIG